MRLTYCDILFSETFCFALSQYSSMLTFFLPFTIYDSSPTHSRSFQIVFCSLKKNVFRTDGPRDGLTDRQTLLQRCEDASKKGVSLQYPVMRTSFVCVVMQEPRCRQGLGYYLLHNLIGKILPINYCKTPHVFQSHLIDLDNVFISFPSLHSECHVKT